MLYRSLKNFSSFCARLRVIFPDQFSTGGNLRQNTGDSSNLSNPLHGIVTKRIDGGVELHCGQFQVEIQKDTSPQGTVDFKCKLEEFAMLGHGDSRRFHVKIDREF